MIQEIVNFVDPDPTVEFDPASRVSGHASLKCASPLSLLRDSSSPSLQRLSPSLVISLSYSVYLSSARTLRHSRRLVHSTKTKEATGPVWSGERRVGKKEKKKKEKQILERRETERSRRDKEREVKEGRGGERGRTQQEKKEQCDEQQK